MEKFIAFSLAILSGLYTPSVLAQGPFCVAHRGNSSAELENSRASLISAARSGVTAIEFDVHHTLDGVAIINHDKTLERVTKDTAKCPRKKKISRLFYRQLQNCELKNGERIPLFKDIVRELKNYPVQLFIEYKSAPSIFDINFLRKEFSDAPERLTIISFKTDYLDHIIWLRKAFTFLKKVNVIRLKGVAHSKNDKYDGLDAKFLGKRHVKSLKAQGKIIGTYTQNSRKKIIKYFNRGVDFVTTNYPERCMDIARDFQ